MGDGRNTRSVATNRGPAGSEYSLPPAGPSTEERRVHACTPSGFLLKYASRSRAPYNLAAGSSCRPPGGMADLLPLVANRTRLCVCVFLVAAVTLCCAVSAQAQSEPKPPQIKASAAILVDAETGQVLFEKNADTPRPPASTTKIMTAMLLLEHCAPDEMIEASKRAEATEGSSLHLKAGEKVSARHMLYALLLRSANDGSVAVAEHIAGSEAKFAEMMTERARQLGATNTTFTNCNGLNDPRHRTTARDLATLARHALKYPEFAEAVKTRYATIERSTDSKDTVLKNHAKLLWKFPGADGVKTGYTLAAGKCFVGSATWNGWRLISVVLNSGDIVGETSALLKYGFTAYERRTLARRDAPVASAPVRMGTTGEVAAVAAQDVTYVARRGSGQNATLHAKLMELEAPVRAGDAVGTLEVREGGRLLYTTAITASTDVDRVSFVAAGSMRGGWFVAAALFTVGIGYVAATAKSPGFGRDRFETIMRGDYRRG